MWSSVSRTATAAVRLALGLRGYIIPGRQALVRLLLGHLDVELRPLELLAVEEAGGRVRGVRVLVVEEAVVVPIELDAVGHHVREHTSTLGALAGDCAQPSKHVRNIVGGAALGQAADVDPRVRAVVAALAGLVTF